MNVHSSEPTRRELLASATAFTVISSMANAQSVSLRPGQGPVDADKLAGELHESNPQFALSLAVARPEEVIWARSHGKSNLEFDVQSTPAHTFRLGSISKVLTATAAARLVSRGVLDLDAPIRTWLKDIPEQHRGTTMRQLLTHRGGVRHYLPKDADVWAPGGQIYQRYYSTRGEILALFIDDPLIAPPGTKVSYSSFGYTLASLVMEEATGTDFRDLISSEIAKPFQLVSLTDDDPLAIRPLRACGYVRSFDLSVLIPAVASTIKLGGGVGNMPQSNPAFCWAGAGFLMNPSDAARFGAAMIDVPGAILTPTERRLLFTPITERTSEVPPMGLGWRVDADAKGRLRWHHEGSTPGGRYSLVVYPELGLAVAMALNVMVVRLDVLAKSSDLADIFG